MTLDWLLLVSLLSAATLAIGFRRQSPLAWLTLLLLFSLTLAGARYWQRHIDQRTESSLRLLQTAPRQGRPGGYIGSSACQACHPDQYRSWHESFHRTMTQYASPDSVRGDFNNVTLELEGETFRLTREGDEFWAEMPDPDWTYGQALMRKAFETGKSNRPPPPGPAPRARKRIGLLTGSHHMQAYWVPSSAGNEQINFPFTFLLRDQRWVPRNSIFVLDPSRPPLRQIWNDICINCHATGGQSRRDPETSITDTRTGELGISCEACHGPAEEHRRVHGNPVNRYLSHHSNQPDPTIVNPARQTSQAASENCSQCHSIRYNDQENWNEEGFLFRPGDNLDADRPLPDHAKLAINQLLPPGQREDLLLWTNSFWMDGMVRVSGREFNGLANSPCYQRGNLSCLSCHSMHHSDPNDQLRAGMDGNNACLQCHTTIGQDPSAHTRHQPESSGSLCYNCHMPHTTYGLLKAIRSHQIDSPSISATINTGRPNACNLCHLDQTLEWTDQQLSSWTGTPRRQWSQEETTTSAAVLWALQGDAGQRALLAWHMGWEAAQTASNPRWLAPYLAELLADPYDAVRYIAGHSLRTLPGFQNFQYDYLAPTAAQAQARKRALSAWTAQPALTESNLSNILLDSKGQINRNKVQSLLLQRDNRPMDLWE